MNMICNFAVGKTHFNAKQKSVCLLSVSVSVYMSLSHSVSLIFYISVYGFDSQWDHSCISLYSVRPGLIVLVTWDAPINE